MIKKLVILSVAIVFVAGASTACNEVDGKLDNWQAVFLTSGQVYYGKLSDSSGPFYTLEDIYYIRRVPGAEEDQAPQFTLVKMGQELHGPQDMIMLNRDHILYIENLTDEGQVAQRIQEAKDALAAAPDGAAVLAPLPADQLTPEEMEQFRKFQEMQRAAAAQQ